MGVSYWITFPSFLSAGYKRTGLGPCTTATITSGVVSDALGLVRDSQKEWASFLISIKDTCQIGITVQREDREREETRA